VLKIKRHAAAAAAHVDNPRTTTWNFMPVNAMSYIILATWYVGVGKVGQCNKSDYDSLKIYSSEAQ